MPESAADWYNPTVRLPRKGQEVWIVTREHSEHAAQFDVQFTQNWPAGVAWVLNEDRSLALDEVLRWIPLEQHVRRAETVAIAPVADSQAPIRREVPDEGIALVREIHAALEDAMVLTNLLTDSALEWSPHPAIPNLRVLGSRMVRIAARMRWIMELESIERSFEPDLPELRSAHDIQVIFRSDVSELEALLRALTPAALNESWTLERNGSVIARLRRGDALRAFGLLPLAIHRAELGLLLTALNVQVPHAYETWAFDDEH